LGALWFSCGHPGYLLVARTWLPQIARFLSRFGILAIGCCVLVLLIDAYQLNLIYAPQQAWGRR
jgi:hypothetical protein